MKKLNLSKYTKGQVFYKGKPIGKPQELAAVYREGGYIWVNFQGIGAGSYPMCIEENGRILIRNGHKCDEIKLQ